MGLAFQPESLDSMRDRYEAALAFEWDALAILTDHQADRPGLHRDHVFDFEDGNRFVISRERQLGGRVCLHVSVSFSPRCAERFPEDRRCENLLILAQKRLAFLQGVSVRELREPSVGMLSGGVVKWWWILDSSSSPAPTKSDTK